MGAKIERNGERQTMILALSLLACLYSVVYLNGSYRKGDLVAPHSLYAFLTLLHFFLPGVLIGLGMAPDFSNIRNAEYVLLAIVFAFAGLIVVQLGSNFAVSGRFSTSGVPAVTSSATRPWKASKIFFVTVALLIIGWATRIYVIQSGAYLQIHRVEQGELEGPFYAAIRMVEFFPLHVICLLSIRYWRPGAHLSNYWHTAFYGCVISEILYWLPSGRKEGVVLAIVLPLLIRYMRMGKLPSWRAVSIFLGFLALLFPLTYLYRVALELGGGAGGMADISAAISEVIGGDNDYGKTPGEIIFGRFSLLEPLSACIRIWQDGIWSPMMGTSYAFALLGLIPRFVWPGKPDLHYGNEFGYVSGIISPSDTLTSISVTFFGESYLNFGFAGLLPLLIIGFLFGIFYKNINTSKHAETWLLVYAISIPTILYVGGTFALYFGGLIKLLPFYYVVGRFIEGRRLVVQPAQPQQMARGT